MSLGSCIEEQDFKERLGGEDALLLQFRYPSEKNNEYSQCVVCPDD